MNNSELHLKLAKSLVDSLMEDIATGEMKDDTQVYNILKQIAEHIDGGDGRMNDGKTAYNDANGRTEIFFSNCMKEHIGDIILDLARCYKSVKVTEIDTGWLVALDGTALEASSGGRNTANFYSDTKTAILTEEEVLEARRRINDDVFDF